MKRFLSRWGAGPALLVGALFAAGCGGSSVKLIPVSGKVTLDGQPVNGGQVTLSPLEPSPTGEPDSKQPESSGGTIDANGTYELFTGGRKGAPVGKYKVTVSPSMMPMMGGGKGAPDMSFDKSYGNPRETPLVIEVVEGASPGAYDLKMKK